MERGKGVMKWGMGGVVNTSPNQTETNRGGGGDGRMGGWEEGSSRKGLQRWLEKRLQDAMKGQ